MNRPDSLRHAIVIGGNMAGLLAAKVLSERCEQVTIVERDDIAKIVEGANVTTAAERKGVPQSPQPHILRFVHCVRLMDRGSRPVG